MSHVTLDVNPSSDSNPTPPPSILWKGRQVVRSILYSPIYLTSLFFGAIYETALVFEQFYKDLFDFTYFLFFSQKHKIIPQTTKTAPLNLSAPLPAQQQITGRRGIINFNAKICPYNSLFQSFRSIGCFASILQKQILPKSDAIPLDLWRSDEVPLDPKHLFILYLLLKHTDHESFMSAIAEPKEKDAFVQFLTRPSASFVTAAYDYIEREHVEPQLRERMEPQRCSSLLSFFSSPPPKTPLKALMVQHASTITDTLFQFSIDSLALAYLQKCANQLGVQCQNGKTGLESIVDSFIQYEGAKILTRSHALMVALRLKRRAPRGVSQKEREAFRRSLISVDADPLLKRELQNSHEQRQQLQQKLALLLQQLEEPEKIDPIKREATEQILKLIGLNFYQQEDVGSIFVRIADLLDLPIAYFHEVYTSTTDGHHLWIKTEPKTILQVEEFQGEPLQQLLTAKVRKEFSPSESCKETFRDVELKLDARTLPQILPIQLKRFEYTKEGGKVFNPTLVPLSPELKLPLHGSEQPATYTLRSVVHYQPFSTSSESGHYIAYVQKEGKILRCDDDYVSVAGNGWHEIPALTHNGYLFFYELNHK